MATKVEVDNITDAWRLGITAAQIEEAAAKSVWQSNPNLLDNWYFGNPVNQRGQMEYPQGSKRYTIDRWYATAAVLVTVNDASIEVTNTSSSGANSLVHPLNPEFILPEGAEMTFSCLTAGGELYSGTLTMPPYGGLHRQAFRMRGGTSGRVYSADDDGGLTRAIFYVPVGDSVELVAAKLELGSVQTLAHQDAQSNWVLNEIPDYHEQLLRCCMSTADSTDTYANNKMTPAAINAVNKAGDTMTGDLVISKNSAKLRLVHTNGKGSELQQYANALAISVYNDNTSSANFRRIKMQDSTNQPDLASALMLQDITESNQQDYPILHTGNKPSGSYTGNGDAANRQIATGGLGSVVMIWSSNGKALVCPVGGIGSAASGVSNILSTAGKVDDGVLTLATTNALLNANGVTYNYQVL